MAEPLSRWRPTDCPVPVFALSPLAPHASTLNYQLPILNCQFSMHPNSKLAIENLLFSIIDSVTLDAKIAAVKLMPENKTLHHAAGLAPFRNAQAASSQVL